MSEVLLKEGAGSVATTIVQPHIRSISNACCVITGGTGGIGQATALALAPHGVHLVLIGRDAARAHSTAAAARKAGASGVDVILADLSSQREVCRAADEISARHGRIDTLVNNVGGLFIRRQVSVDGLEMTWALNHMAPFLLTNLLLGQLRAGAPSRILNVSSGQHSHGRLDFENPSQHTSLAAYAQSKLANILFTRALAKRLDSSAVTACAMRPGRAASQFGFNNGWLWRVVRPFMHRRAAPCELAGSAVAGLVLDPHLSRGHGSYFDRQEVADPAPQAYDVGAADRLWELSASMIVDPQARRCLETVLYGIAPGADEQ